MNDPFFKFIYIFFVAYYRKRKRIRFFFFHFFIYIRLRYCYKLVYVQQSRVVYMYSNGESSTIRLATQTRRVV